MNIEPVLLTTARVITFLGAEPLTNASGFFFERDRRLYLVTSRHVVHDPASGHLPNRLEIELHLAGNDFSKSIGFSIPLFVGGLGQWRAARDSAGDVDVAMIELDRAALPADTAYRAFTPRHLPAPTTPVEIGSSLLVVGYPLGFHDTMHHLPVVRQAVVASSFGVRFEGQGYFLTDARTHRGTSGAPLVMRVATPPTAGSDLPWLLLGIHSARLDSGGRDRALDEALGLNCAWYADILMTLSDRRP